MESKKITLVRSDDLSDRAPYAYAAMPAVGARLVFTAGACPLDADGETVAPGDVATQAEQVMKNLRTALRAAGADLDNVIEDNGLCRNATAGGPPGGLGGREAPLRQPRRAQHTAGSQCARLPRSTGRSRSRGSSRLIRLCPKGRLQRQSDQITGQPNYPPKLGWTTTPGPSRRESSINGSIQALRGPHAD
jgi:Endoribonuclease L-PSP